MSHTHDQSLLNPNFYKCWPWIASWSPCPNDANSFAHRRRRMIFESYFKGAFVNGFPEMTRPQRSHCPKGALCGRHPGARSWRSGNGRPLRCSAQATRSLPTSHPWPRPGYAHHERASPRTCASAPRSVQVIFVVGAWMGVWCSSMVTTVDMPGRRARVRLA